MQPIYCSKCGASNIASNDTCKACGAILLKTENELPKLKNELIALKNEYETKFKSILDKIEFLENDGIKNTEPAINTIGQPNLPNPAEISTEKNEKQKEVIAEQKKEVVRHKTASNTQTTPSINNPQTTPTKQQIKKGKTTLKDSEPIAKKPRKTLWEAIQTIPVLSVFIEEIGVPFLNLWEFAKKTYHTYKKKNQLPVFFMTMAGIGILLFGFGYLMQLSIGYFGELSELVKIGFGFACSTGFIIWATRLIKKNEKYGEFSSALLSLSIGLNYLFIYFLTNLSDTHPVFTLPLTGFAFIILNTLLAIYFALRYETKIVAVLSLLCGAFTPFYLHSDSSSPGYFAYLWVLGASSIFIARKIKWETLGIISFLTATSIIELAIANSLSSFSLWTYVIIFHSFAYLFIWFALFDGKKIRTELSKTSIILIAGNISIFLFNLFYLFANHDNYELLGYMYLVNAMVFFSGLWILHKQLNKQTKLVLLVIAGSFIAFAIPAIFSTALMGLFWSIEALVLVFLGFIFSMPSVRKEGYVLLTIALVKITLSFNDFWFIGSNPILFTNGYMSLLILGLICVAILYFFNKYKKERTTFEGKLYTLSTNATTLWFISVFLITTAFFTYTWLAFANYIVALVLIIIGYALKLKFTRIAGYVVLITCIIYATIQATVKISILWDSSLFTAGYANLIGIGLFLIIIQGILHKLNNYKSREKLIKNDSYISKLNEGVAIWFTALFLVSSFYFLGNYTFNLALMPMFIIIYLGNKNKLVLAEYLGLAYSLIILIGAFTSFTLCESFRFTKQPLFGKIAMVEVLFILFFLKSFYNKFLPNSSKNKAMDIVREVFYWMVPLLILSPIKNHLPDFIPVAIWGSAFINYIFFKYTKRESLIIEFYILAGIGSIASLVSEYYYWAIPASLLVISYVFINQRAYKYRLFHKSVFKSIFTPAVYYLGFCLFVISLYIFDGISDGLVISAVYFSTIVVFRKKMFPIRNNYLFSFWLALAITIIGLVAKYVEGGTSNQLLSMAPLIPFGFLLYSKNAIYATKQKLWKALVVFMHVLLLTSYSLLLDSSWLTITLTIHAIIILFTSIKKQYKALVWQSIAYFCIALIKLFFWDISHFSATQKVSVFVIIGSMLIGSAFLYMKLKSRFEYLAKKKMKS